MHNRLISLLNVFDNPSVGATLKEAMKIVTYFSRSTQMMGILRNQGRCANLELTFVMPTDTQWYSHYNCLSSLVKARGSLQVNAYFTLDLYALVSHQVSKSIFF